MEAGRGAQLLQICVLTILCLMESGRGNLKASQTKIYVSLDMILFAGVTHPFLSQLLCLGECDALIGQVKVTCPFLELGTDWTLPKGVRLREGEGQLQRGN